MLATLMLLLLVVAPAACSNPGPGDRMTGKIVAAQSSTTDPRGPQITAPGEFVGVAQVQPYDSNGKVGTQMIFTNITFGQFNQVGDVVSQAFDNSTVAVQMRVRRTGSTVVLTGTADLTTLPPSSGVIVISLQFPGPVTATNGQQESNDLVTWTLNSGTSAALTAEAAYADPSIATFREWTWITALVALLAALAVASIAYVRRDRSPKPGADSDEHEALVELPQWLREKLKR